MTETQPLIPENPYGGIAVPQNSQSLPLAEEDDPAPFTDVFAAAWRKRTIEADAWGLTNRMKDALTLEMQNRLSAAEQQTIMRQMNGRKFADPGAAWRTLVLDAGARQKQADPESWGDYPIDGDQFQARIDQDRRAQWEEAQAVLDLPGGGFAEFLGTASRSVAEPANLLLAPLGLEGSAVRILAGEVGLGALAEGLSVPTERRIARELDLPSPSLAWRMAEGGLMGGAFAGLFIGGARLWRYAAEKGRAAHDLPEDGLTAQEREAEISAAVNDLTGDVPIKQLAADLAARPAAPGQPLRMSDFDFSPSGNASPRTNRVGYVFGKLLALGWEPHQAAGLVGNFMQESGPALQTRAVGDGGNAFGMGQWNGPRMRALQAFAAKQGKDPSDLDTQIAFFDLETRTTEATAAARIKGAKTAREAAAIASEAFWRPGIPHLNRRMAYADTIYGQFSEGAIPKWHGTVRAPSDDAPTFSTSRGYTRSGQVTAGDNIRVDVTYEVVDASLLRRASGDLQPRDRSRAASDEQVAEIAARLDPARLMPSPEADRGAPVVGPDSVIESGNGRVMAIERAYARHPDRAEAYRAEITAAGYEIPEGVSRPVLIARRTSDLDAATRQRFVREANTSAVARMSATERSAADATQFDEATLGLHVADQPLASAANKPFVMRALASLPQAERGALIDPGGALNAEGVRRLQQALFARAWNAPDIIARFAETDAGELRGLLDALAQAAPEWAALRADVAAGLVRPEMDITDYVLDAMRLIAAARELAAQEGKAVAGIMSELLDEVDLIDGAVSPLTAALVGKFWRGGRAAPKDEVAGFLTRYAAEARKAGSTEASLLGDGPGPAEVLRAIDREAFADLPDEFGAARAPAAAIEIRELPEAAYADGAASPEAIAADEVALADLRRADLDQPSVPDLAEVAPDAYVRTLAAAQPAKTMDDLYARAAVAQSRLVAAGQQIADDLGITFKDPGLKNRAEAEAKLARKQYDTPARLTDVSRGGFVLTDVADGDALVDRLAQEFDLVDEGWNRTVAGYVDRKVMLRHPDGTLSEVQMWTAAMADAKSGRGTELYTLARKLPPGDPERSRLLAEQEALYSAAAGSDFDAIRFNADGTSSGPKLRSKPASSSSADARTAAVSRTSSASTSVQSDPGSSLATATNTPGAGDARTAGRPSQLQNESDVIGEIPPLRDSLNMGAGSADVNTLRAEFGDLTYRLDDGTEISAADILDDIEADDELANVLNLCNLGAAA